MLNLVLAALLSVSPAQPPVVKGYVYQGPVISVKKPVPVKASDDSPRLVVVSASWCIPCAKLKNQSLPEVMKTVPVEIVDGDQDKSYNVASYPTTICFLGDQEQWRVSGFVDASYLLGRVADSKPTPAITYDDLFARVRKGETIRVAVGTSAKAQFKIDSVKGFESDVYECFLENGEPMMRKYVPQAPPMVMQSGGFLNNRFFSGSR